MPRNNPDLVPVREAQRMAALFAALRGDRDVAGRPEEFQGLLAKAQAAAQGLAECLGKAGGPDCEAPFDALNKSCKACHAGHRDHR